MVSHKKMTSIISYIVVFICMLSMNTIPVFAGLDSGDNYPEPWRSGTSDNLAYDKDGKFRFYADNWGYAVKNCTSWVAWALHDRNNFDKQSGMGNGTDWGIRAEEKGYTVNKTPAIGSVAWLKGTQKNSFGHVAYVKDVNLSKNTVTIEEYNYKSSGNYNLREELITYFDGYIHFKDIGADITTTKVTNTGAKNITDTNAVVYGRVDKPSSYSCTMIGVRILASDKTTLIQGYYKKPSKAYVGESYLVPYFDLNKEFGMTLLPETMYYYDIVARVNDKEYWSDPTSFTTHPLSLLFEPTIPANNPMNLPIQVKPVDAYDLHSFYILSDGSLYAAGYNYYGALGDGTRISRSIPVKILENAVCVDSSSIRAYAITSNGDLYAWGIYNEAYDPEKYTNEQLRPKKIMAGISRITAYSNGVLVINSKGELFDIKDDEQNVTKIMSDVKCASRSVAATFVVKNDGSLWSWGENYFGILGDGTLNSRSQPKQILANVLTVSSGTDHVLALKNDGSVWSWGRGGGGAIGYGELKNIGDPGAEPWGDDRYKPVKVMEDVKSISASAGGSMAIKNDNSLWIWGGCFDETLNFNLPPTGVPYKALENVAYVSSDNSYIMAVKTDGSLWMWGDNSSGTFGDGTTDFVDKPTFIMDNVSDMSVASDYAMILKNDGTVWTTGTMRSNANELGTEIIKVNTGINSNHPVQVFSGAKGVSAGEYHNLILDNKGTVWSWGDNTCGKLGNGTEKYGLEPQAVFNGAKSIYASEISSTIEKADNSLWTCGGMEDSYYTKSTKIFSDVIAYTGRNLIIGTDRVFYSENIHRLASKPTGQRDYEVMYKGLGYDSNEPLLFPSDTILFRKGGDKDAFFALTSKGDLYMSIHYFQPQKIMTDIVYVSETPYWSYDDVHVPYIVKKDGSLLRYGKKETILTNIKKVECPRVGVTVMALTKDGKLYAWGQNEFGVVGNGTQAIRPEPAQYRIGILTSGISSSKSQ